jgi:hypothetical protein
MDLSVERSARFSMEKDPSLGDVAENPKKPGQPFGRCEGQNVLVLQLALLPDRLGNHADRMVALDER